MIRSLSLPRSFVFLILALYGLLFGADLARAQLTFDPANPPTSSTPPTDIYYEYSGNYSHQKGPKTVMVFLVQPSDGATWTNPPSFATLDGQLNSASQDYYNASYHQTWFGPKRDGVHDVPRLVVTPVMILPKTAAQYLGSFSTLQADCQAAARALGGNYAAGAVWDYNNFDRWVVMSNTKLVSSTGLAYVGGRFAWTGGSLSGSVAEHELGHNWGVFHANSWDVPAGDHPRSSNGSSTEYADGWDLMGHGNTAQMFNPQFRENLGFLERSRGEALDITTSGTYRLYDYLHNDSRQTTSLVRALVIPISSFTDPKRVILGFGHLSGVDGGLGRTDWNRNAVTVHSKLSDGSNRIDTTPGSSLTDDADDSSIKIGRTYSEGPSVNGNQIYGGFHITPIARGNTTVNGQAHEWIDVVVNYENEIVGNLPPGNVTVASTAPAVWVGSTVAYTAAPNVAITLNATALDPNGDALAWDWHFGRTSNGSVSITSCSTQSPVYPNPGLYRVDVVASDMKGGNSTGSAWVNVGSQPVYNATSVSTVGNLSYRYYENTFTAVPDFQTQFPVEQGSVEGFSLAPRNRDDNFAFLFEGYIDIPATDIYSFYVKADDGAKLFINGVLVVNKDGVASVATEASGSIQLAAGLHSIRLEYFHQSGSELLEVTWSTLTQPRGAIPASRLVQIDPGVNPPPSVSVLTPAPGETFVVGASVQMTANATDADGIARVQYFFNGSLLGESTDGANGFPVLWSDVSVGNKTIVAVAYDTSGKLSNSTPVSFVVTAPEPRNSLGLNFGATNATQTLSPNEAVGAVYTTTYWNNYSTSSSAVGGNIVYDQTGTDAGVRVTWNASGSGSGTFNNLADSSTGAGRLLRGGISRRYDIEPSPNPNPYATVSNISFTQYDVYVYFDYTRTDTDDTTVQRFVLTPSEGVPSVLFGRNSGNYLDQLGDYPNYDTWVGFREAKATSLNATDSDLFGNYVVFRNQTASSFTVEATRNNGTTNGTNGRHRRYFNAIQIVEAPATIPRIVVSESAGNTTVTEQGSADTYDLRLSVAPTANVTVTVSAGSQLIADPAVVVFSPADWNLPKTIVVRAVDDVVQEGPHTANLTHTVSGGGNYGAVTSARNVTVSIVDNDQGTVAVIANGTAVEGPAPTNATFQIVRSGLGDYSTPLTVNFTVNGTAIAGSDYNLTGASVLLNATSGEGSAVIPAGQAQVFLTIVPLNDAAAENDRMVQINLSPSTMYVLGTPASASLPLLDDDGVDYFTEYFESAAAFDLNGQSITFTPANGTYTASREIVTAFPSGTSSFTTFSENSTAMSNGSIGGGTPDDGWWNHTLNATFPFFGANYTLVRVGTNGHLSFNGSSFSDSGNILDDHFTSGRPRISGLARDLNPSTGGSVGYRRITGDAFGNRTVFFWKAVANYSGSGTNSFQIELCDDGRIRMTWLDCVPSGSCVVGLSAGNTTLMPSSPYDGTGARPFFETDLSSYPAATLTAPLFSSAPPLLATVGQPYLYTAVASDPGGPALSFSVPTQPAWLTLTDHGNATATLAGTPTAAGTYPVVLQVSDGNLTATQSFNISVAPAAGNHEPTFTSTPAALAIAGANYSYTLTASDPDGQALSFSASVKPGWLTLVDHGNGTATLSGSVPIEALSAPITLAVTDGWTTASQSFTLAVNAPPVARIVRPSMTAVRLDSAGSNLLLEALATDDGLPVGGNLTTAWSLVSGPGNVTFSAPDSLQTTASFPVDGTYVVRFLANDGNATATDELTVLVNVDGTAILANGLQGHWRFEEGSGNLTADVSGNGRNATVTNANWTAGISGNAISSTGNASTFAEATYGEPSNITVSAWVRPSVVPASSDRILWTFRSGSNNRLRAYLTNGTRRLRVLADRSTTDGIWEAPFQFSAETWTHVVVVYSTASTSNVPTIYIDGVAQTLTPVSNPAGSLNAGTSSFRMAGNWYGVIDEVRVYNRLVSASEIPLLGLTGPINTAPTVSAGPDVSGILGAAVELSGNATDDGIPTPPNLALAWSLVGGPGNATFGNASLASSNATFDQAGTYVLRLTADDGELTTYDEATVTVQRPPPAPTNLTATANGTSAIDLAWTDQALDENAYAIERRTGADPFTEVAVLGADSVAYSDSGLLANTTYTYRVRVTNNSGSTYSANVSATTEAASGGSEFSTWIAGFPSIPADQRDPDDDWDRDSAPNLVEYAMILNPTQPDADLLPKASVVQDGTQHYLQISYRQRTGGTGTIGIDYTVDGILYAIEVNPALSPSGWQNSATLVEAVGTPVDNGDGTQTVTVRVKTPVGTDPHKFARLRITMQ